MVTSLMISDEIVIKHPAYNDHISYLMCMTRTDYSFVPYEQRVQRLRELQQLKTETYNAQYDIKNEMKKDESFIFNENDLKNFSDDDDIKNKVPNEKFIVMHIDLDPNRLSLEEILLREQWCKLEKDYVNSQRLIYNLLHMRSDLYTLYSGLASSRAENFGSCLFERYLIWKEMNFKNVFEIPITDRYKTMICIGKILSLTIFTDVECYWLNGFNMEELYKKGEMFYEAHFYCKGNNVYNLYAYYELIFLSISNQLMHKTSYALFKELLIIATFYFTNDQHIEWLDKNGEFKTVTSLVDTCLYSYITNFKLSSE